MATVPGRPAGTRRGGAGRGPRAHLERGNIYLAVEADEDIPYLLNYIGEEQLLVASDYPHADPSREESLVQVFEDREDISEGLREKMMLLNPSKLYGLSI